MNRPRVVVIGLGKVGMTLAGLFLKKGYEVFGIDNNKALLDSLRNNTWATDEPQTESNIKSNLDRLIVDSSFDNTFECTDFLCIVPTPSLPDGSFSHQFVLSAWKDICEKLGNFRRNEELLFIIKSTLSPGTCRKLHDEIRQIYPNQSWSLAYNPEFIALGEVAKGMERPELVLVGADSPGVSLRASHVTRPLRESVDVKEKHLDTVGAEIAKIAVNTFVTMKITFANQIGLMADRLGVSSPLEVLEAIGSDPRIGNSYLRPGLGYGGPCFPRDNRALARSMEYANLTSRLPQAIDSTNAEVPNLVLEKLHDVLELEEKRLLFLGISYKTGTPHIEESQALLVAKGLMAAGHEVKIIDPLVDGDSVGLVVQKTIQLSDATDCDLVIVAVKSPHFEQFLEDLGGLESKKVLHLG